LYVIVPFKSVNDYPEKCHGIEIYDCFEYLSNRLHWNGSGLILHEFCHIIHQLVLPKGLYNKNVLEAYNAAMESGKYEDVFRRDWAGQSIDTDTAYATLNHKEFFSELSVTYLSNHYKYLSNHCRIKEENILSCSPPIIEAGALQRIKNNEKYSRACMAAKRKATSTSLSDHRSLLERILNIKEKSDRCCNKFFPFVREQLKEYDECTYVYIESLWHEIGSWKDYKYANSIFRIWC